MRGFRITILSLLIIVLTIFISNNIYALSDNFIFIIDTVGIPRYNSQGYEINETVYEVYQVFVYSNPVKLSENQNAGQRWTSSKFGLWEQGKGKYVGQGVQGEYSLLGYDYFGNPVNNHHFIMDSIPTVNPELWNYVQVDGGYVSWQNKGINLKQLEYMKSSKWYFADITKTGLEDDPNNQIEYNLSANKVGLDKARLEAVATWKTKGSIYTEHFAKNGIWYATFWIKAISADATLNGNIQCDNRYTLEKTEDVLVIPIKYQVNVENMSEIANVSDIKEINASLTINDKKVSSTSGGKITSVGGEYMLVISRDEFSPNQTHQINLNLSSYMKTSFAMDGLIQNTVKKSIYVKVLDKPKNIVQDVFVKMLEKDNEKWVVSPLAQLFNTNSVESIGVTEAGKTISVSVCANKISKTINPSTITPKIILDGKEIDCAFLDASLSKNMYITINIKIPEDTITTIYGINSLRRENNNYYSINTSDIGKRKSLPHEMSIYFEVLNAKCEASFLFDTIDSYMENVNSSVDARINGEKVDYKIWAHI